MPPTDATAVENDLRREAQRLCAAVRRFDRSTVTTILNRAHTRGLCVMLAAAIPPGRSSRDLLAWTDESTVVPLVAPADDIQALAARTLVVSAAVRAWDRDRVTTALADSRPHALAVVAAAMVPDTTAFSDLLAWTRNPYTDRPVLPDVLGHLDPATTPVRSAPAPAAAAA